MKSLQMHCYICFSFYTIRYKIKLLLSSRMKERKRIQKKKLSGFNGKSRCFSFILFTFTIIVSLLCLSFVLNLICIISGIYNKIAYNKFIEKKVMLPSIVILTLSSVNFIEIITFLIKYFFVLLKVK